MQPNLDWDGGAGCFAITGSPESLDLFDRFSESHTGVRLVVEVRLRRPHGTDGECVAGGVAATGGLGVVGEFQPGSDSDLDVVERSSCGFGPFADRVEIHIGLLGEERSADPALAHLAGEAQVGRAHRGDVHRDRPHGDGGAHRFPLAFGQRQFVGRSLVRHPLARGDLVDDLDRLACAGDRLVEAHAVPALHYLWATRAHPENESTVRHRL